MGLFFKRKLDPAQVGLRLFDIVRDDSMDKPAGDDLGVTYDEGQRLKQELYLIRTVACLRWTQMGITDAKLRQAIAVEFAGATKGFAKVCGYDMNLMEEYGHAAVREDWDKAVGAVFAKRMGREHDAAVAVLGSTLFAAVVMMARDILPAA